MTSEETGWIPLAVTMMATPVWLIHVHLRLARLRARAVDAWAAIEESLRRRHAVALRLVETLRDAAPRERATVDAVAEALDVAQASRGPGEAAHAEARLCSGLSRLLALASLYPDLRQRADVAALQRELAELEARIADARSPYNGRVTDYNAAIDNFPCFYYHDRIGFERRPAFVAPPERLRARPAAGEPPSRPARAVPSPRPRPGAKRRPRPA